MTIALIIDVCLLVLYVQEHLCGAREKLLGLRGAEAFDWLKSIVAQHAIDRQQLDEALTHVDEQGAAARWLAQHPPDARDALWAAG